MPDYPKPEMPPAKPVGHESKESPKPAGHTPAPKEGRPEEKTVPKAPAVPDMIDFNYPPWHEKNRGNVDFKPVFDGDANSDEGIAVTRKMASGDFVIPDGSYDNVTGNPAFSAPNVLNPPYRWDTTGRQSQWVRP